MWIIFHKVFLKICSWPQGTFRSQALSSNGAWYFYKVSVAIISHLFLLMTLVGLLETPSASQWQGRSQHPWASPGEILLIIISLDSQHFFLWKHCHYIASPLSEATFLFLLCSPLSSRRLRRSAGVSVRLSVQRKCLGGTTVPCTMRSDGDMIWKPCVRVAWAPVQAGMSVV